MNSEILRLACEKLKWEYQIKGEVLYVFNTQNALELRGEYALKVSGNTVTYNRYYMKNGRELVTELKKQFHQINVEYAYETVLREFQSVGFKLLPDFKFKETEKEKKRFKMVGHSKLPNESEKRTEIDFSILHDGTIVSDSNYIPGDMHELADQAMAGIDRTFGTTRKEGEQIKRKQIPLKYQNKAYCKANNKIVAKY